MPQDQSNLKKPPFRKLRGYAFDPSLSTKIDTASVNEIIYKVLWEDLAVGPVGEYLEVIDFDPTVKTYYKSVDLNQPYLLAQDGLDPSESNPQFHQQMVYAVAMTTISNFERALGRKVLWSPHRLSNGNPYEEYVGKLRIYPHALREANAYYSPQKKALLFGYFSALPGDQAQVMPDSLVFTCLSHDIIAHEVTHAILDGMLPYYNEPTNPDVLAFHEAFADIVALFQHFTFPEVLKHQIARTRGDLESQNLLGELAQQFGSAIGNYGSLRDAIGENDPVTKKWRLKVPKPDDYIRIVEPHARGSILVAAIFEAFLIIYKSRAADLLRIASNGTGILPQGELHPDLVNRLAEEASRAAQHVLNMCVRALDYCPPVDIYFGDYLRAIISADMDLVEDDPRHYRLAFIEAFRKRGIYPKGVKTLSVESLQYRLDETMLSRASQPIEKIGEFLREYRNEMIYENDRHAIYKISNKFISNKADNYQGLHRKLFFKFETPEFEKMIGILFRSDIDRRSLGIKTTVAYGDGNEGPSFQIQNLRLVSRIGPNGNQVNQIIFSIAQRVGVIPQKNGEWTFFPVHDNEPMPDGGFQFRGGCTLIFDLDTTELKYAISKPLLDVRALDKMDYKIDLDRVERQYEYQFSDEGLMGLSEYHKYFFGSNLQTITQEPFAILHQH